MKTELKKLARGQMELIIELTVEEYQPFLDQAAKNISQTIKIPGFRPGKADLETLKQRVGENEIWQEAFEIAVRKTLIKAIDENKLITIGAPQVDIIKLAAGNPVSYKAVVNLLPEVKLADYKKIKVERKPIEITEEKIKKVLSDLQKNRAKESLVDRATQKGDKVEIDFEAFLDKIPVDRGQSKNFPLVIGENTFIPGFEDQLIGLSKGQNKEFQLEFPKNYHQKNLAGKLVDFKVQMNAVYQLESPELNDEFAKSLGDFQDLKTVENKIKENLETEAKIQEENRLEGEMIEKIVDQSQFTDIPDLLIDSETKKMTEELEHNLSHQGVKFEDYLSHLHKTKEELLLEFTPQALKRVKSALTLRAINDAEKISVSEEDIETEIQQTAAEYGNDPAITQRLRDPHYREYLQNILGTKKVVDYLKSVMVK